ncbi:MAG: ATP-binding cassette domain-containing protein [Nitriliruptorales bacterium]|nr:ATP-binding cassette domain-containing protein [Nitriliruptorales bacterium]
MSGGAEVGQLTFDQAVKYYQREDGEQMLVLDGVSFQAKESQVTALIGPSGCGKSTLLNTVVGLEQLDGGSLSFGNGSVDGQERPYIGYVFQSARLLPWKTVGDNVRLGLLGASVPKDYWERRVHKYLELVGLVDFVDQYPLYLSGGMQQRVGLARALAVEAGIVLMDEPFASVDEITALRLRETTRHLCVTLERTVLFVTHNINEAAYISDTVVLLSARPARVRAVVENPLPLERKLGSPEVYQFANELGAMVHSDDGGLVVP